MTELRRRHKVVCGVSPPSTIITESTLIRLAALLEVDPDRRATSIYNHCQHAFSARS